MMECVASLGAMFTGGRVLVITALLIIASESRPWTFPDIVQQPQSLGFNHSHHNRSFSNVSVLDQNGTQIKNSPEESKIVFPGQTEFFTPEENGQQPKCADEEGFCESADDYPRDYVRKIIQNEAKVYTFGSDYMDVDIRIYPDKDMSLCPSMEQLVYPKIAQNKDEKWLYVINQDSYLQGIRIEKCARQGSCTFADNFPSGYTTSCQQKYIYRKLLALGEDGRPVTDSFRLPSCCSCVVTKLF